MVVLPGDLDSCGMSGCKAVKQHGFELQCHYCQM